MSTHNICCRGKLEKISILFGWKMCLNLNYALRKFKIFLNDVILSAKGLVSFETECENNFAAFDQILYYPLENVINMRKAII